MKNILLLCFGVFILLNNDTVMCYYDRDITVVKGTDGFGHMTLYVLQDVIMIKHKNHMPIFVTKTIFKKNLSEVKDYKYADIFDTDLKRIDIKRYGMDGKLE